MTKSGEHKPVLGATLVEALAIHSGMQVVDATFGHGGHTSQVLTELGEEGRVLALDRDPSAIRRGELRFGSDLRFQIGKCPFSHLHQFLAERGWTEVDAILADLGVSSAQLADPERGFSFHLPGPLDMRMDPESGATASQWLQTVDLAELERVLREYGEERYARRIARALVQARQRGLLLTTTELADLVRAVIPGRGEIGKDKATRTFQAVRMAVNRELDELGAFLEAATEVLRPGGRLGVIAFHSVEDRKVKEFIRFQAATCVCPPDWPVCRCDKQARLHPLGRLRPSEAEKRENPRARSAIARIAEKVAA